MKTALSATADKVMNEDSEAYTRDLLRQSKENFNSDAVFSILSRTMKVLNADGKIHSEEERLMKDFLGDCGIPRELYSIS